MTGARSPQDLAAALTAHAGGYLRNPVREPRVTCRVCTTPVDGFDLCYPCREHRLLVGLALAQHTSCAARMRGVPITHWTTVPSLAGRQGEHPLHHSAAMFPQGTELVAEPATTDNPRGLSTTHFRLAQQLPPSAHVLVIDDTWVSDGHMQSLVLALRKAGATHVSALAIARWLKPDRDPTREFVRTRLTSDFQPPFCPWTAHACP